MNELAKPMETAVANLLAALDRTPRNEWSTEILMAMTAVKALGHAEGYRLGSFDLEAAAPVIKASGSTASPLPYQPTQNDAGEDKALSNDAPTADELAEDLGHEFLRAMARQIGQWAQCHDVTPSDAKVKFSLIAGAADVTASKAQLSFYIHNPNIFPTEKGA